MPADFWTNAGILVATAVVMLAGYYGPRVFKQPSRDPVLAGIGIELGNREQMDQLISEVAGCRKALDVLADRRTNEIEEMHQALLERLDAQEKRVRPPPRRRRS